MKKLFYLFLFIAVFIAIDCGEGITPEPDISGTGFSGIIDFVSEWPDSIKRTHLVVFDSTFEEANDFNILNLKYVSLEIPFGVSSFSYNTVTDSAVINALDAGDYEYVAVVQSSSAALSLVRADWFVSGIFYKNNNTSVPGVLILPENKLVTGINITVDYNNPPPQPPGGAE